MTDQFKLLVFDWDGTLMNSEHQIVACMQAAIETLSLDYRDEAAIKNVIGLGLHEAVSSLYPGSDAAMHHTVAQQYREYFLSGNVATAELFDGVADLLASLDKRQHYLAVATGKGRAGLDYALRSTGCEDTFHVTRTADETRSKPHPQMLEEIMDFAGVSPAQTLMIGDTEYDIEMAHNAGAAALAVSYGVHAKERLLQLNPVACVDSVPELGQWLEINRV
jgi:phosphoglycolate phosphatase